MNAKRLLGWVAVLAPVMWACESYEMPPIIPQTGAAITSPATGGTLVLTNEQAAASDSIEFTVGTADFGMTGVVTHTIQMDAAGANFSSPVEFGATTSNIIKVSVEELNEGLIGKGLVPLEPANVEFRVKSSINQPLSPITGEVITLSVTPYDADIAFPVLYVPGDYQGWSPENEATVLKSVDFNNIYSGYVHILPGGTGQFKVSETNEWVDGRNYGDNDGDGDLDADGANIEVTEFGTYFMTVDFEAKTYELEGPLYWGIIGDATPGGWDSETKMQFDRELNVLTITTDLNQGEMKFRANQNWDFNYGGANGELEVGGANIPVAEAGNYTVTLDFNTPGEVKYTLTKN